MVRGEDGEARLAHRVRQRGELVGQDAPFVEVRRAGQGGRAAVEGGEEHGAVGTAQLARRRPAEAQAPHEQPGPQHRLGLVSAMVRERAARGEGDVDELSGGGPVVGVVLGRVGQRQGGATQHVGPAVPVGESGAVGQGGGAAGFAGRQLGRAQVGGDLGQQGAVSGRDVRERLAAQPHRLGRGAAPGGLGRRPPGPEDGPPVAARVGTGGGVVGEDGGVGVEVP